MGEMRLNSRLQRPPGIYLIGFMGSGKSTVGKMLAEALGWTYVDLDEEIEAGEGCAITDIFDLRGEEEFRRIESAALERQVRQVRLGRPRVLALGGGAFTVPANREMLRAAGVSIWLDCPPEVAWNRVSTESHRPLARDAGRFHELFRLRLPVYAGADYQVDARLGPEAVVKAILELPGLFQ